MENLDYRQFALDTDDIVFEARQRCMTEMYKRAQPSADYMEIYEGYKRQQAEGKKPEAVFEHYYLSQEEFLYIRNKYLKVYHLEDGFKNDCDILIRDIEDGCIKDKYISERVDEDGFKHPGYRGYEDVTPLKNEIGEENSKKVVDFIKDRKDFYHFNRLAESFNFSVTLGDSPTSNAETVKEYWKTQGVEVEIDPRHHDENYFWSEEHGCLDEEEY